MRVEVRNQESDKDYVNAIECADEDAETLSQEFASRGFSVKTVGADSGDGSESAKKKSSAKKTASAKARTGQSGTGSNSQKGKN